MAVIPFFLNQGGKLVVPNGAVSSRYVKGGVTKGKKRVCNSFDDIAICNRGARRNQIEESRKNI